MFAQMDITVLTATTAQGDIKKLDPARIVAVRRENRKTIAAPRYNKTGKNDCVAYPWTLRLNDYICRRVYARCIAPSGQPIAYYVRIDGVRHYLDYACWQRMSDLDGHGLPVSTHNLDDFTRQYLETALWSSTDDKDWPMDREYSIRDFEESALANAIADCAQFQRDNAALLALAYDDPNFQTSDGQGPESLAGYCFWMDRNGHGVGFWDRDIKAEYVGRNVGDLLSDACDDWSPVDLYIGWSKRVKKVCQ